VITFIKGATVVRKTIEWLPERNCGVSWDFKEDKTLERIPFWGLDREGE